MMFNIILILWQILSATETNGYDFWEASIEIAFRELCQQFHRNDLRAEIRKTKEIQNIKMAACTKI